MNLDKLKRNLSKHGTVEVIKAGTVFTLLMTGNRLNDFDTIIAIQSELKDAISAEYPVLEAVKNGDGFYLMITKPASL